MKKFLGVLVLLVLAFWMGRMMGSPEVVEVQSEPKIEKEYVYRTVEVEVEKRVEVEVAAEMPNKCILAFDQLDRLELDVEAISTAGSGIARYAGDLQTWTVNGQQGRVDEIQTAINDHKDDLSSELFGFPETYSTFDSLRTQCLDELS